MATFTATHEYGTILYHYDTSLEVQIYRLMGWVLIKDMSTTCDPEDRQDDIFLDGHNAEKFIEEVDLLCSSEPDMNPYIAELCVATPYAENYWN